MKTIIYTPTGGVCSRKIEIDHQEETVVEVRITGGCSGNSQGIAHLVRGMTAQQIVKRLRGIDCKGKGTSCPDQLAQALEPLCEEHTAQQK